jgi:hypothetical protein
MQRELRHRRPVELLNCGKVKGHVITAASFDKDSIIARNSVTPPTIIPKLAYRATDSKWIDLLYSNSRPIDWPH